MEVSGYLHFLATLPMGKNQGTHGIGGWVGSLERAGRVSFYSLRWWSMSIISVATI